MERVNQSLDELIRGWSALLNSHRNGNLHTACFKELFKDTWDYFIENTDWSGNDDICIDTCHIPLILYVFEFSKRRELPDNVPRRIFEAATTFCESLVNSLSKYDLGTAYDAEECSVTTQAIVTGYIELGISCDLSKVIHIDQFEEEFEWLCQHYGKKYGY